MKKKFNLSPVFYYEWKGLVRSKSFLWFTALIFLVGIYAILYGGHEVDRQQQKIALLENHIDSAYRELSNAFQTKNDTLASFVGEKLGVAYSNPPSRLAALSFGQRDIHKFTQQISAGSYFYNKYASGYENKTMNDEIVNPFKSLTGHIDLSFVFIFLFPLYFILLAHNIFSVESENSTLNFLSVQNVPVGKIIQTKLILRFLIVVTVGVLLLVIGGMANGLLTKGGFLVFLLAFVIYMFYWGGIIALVVSLKKNSGISALLLVSIWMGFVFLIPALLNGYLGITKPTDSRIALGVAVQKANAEIWNLPDTVKIKQFKTVRPAYTDAFYKLGSWEDPKFFRKLGSWEDPKFFRVNDFLTDLEILPFEQKRIEQVEEQIVITQRLNYFSPALLSQSVFNELSGTNARQLLGYDTLTYGYHNKVNRFFDDLIFLNNNKITREQIKNQPSPIYKPQVDYKMVSFYLVFLFLIGVLAGFGAFRSPSHFSISK